MKLLVEPAFEVVFAASAPFYLLKNGHLRLYVETLVESSRRSMIFAGESLLAFWIRTIISVAICEIIGRIKHSRLIGACGDSLAAQAVRTCLRSSRIEVIRHGGNVACGFRSGIIRVRHTYSLIRV